MQCDQCGSILQRDDARFCANCGAVIGKRERKPSLSSPSDDAALSSARPKHDTKKPLREQLAWQPSVLSAARNAQEKPFNDNPANDLAPEEQVRPTSEKDASAQPQAPIVMTSGDQPANIEKSENAELAETAQASLPEPERQSAQSELQSPQPRAAVSPPAIVKNRQAPVTRDFERRGSPAVNWPAPVTHVALTDNAMQDKEVADSALAEPPASPVVNEFPANAVKTSPTEMSKRELHVKVWKQPVTTSAAVNEIASSSTTLSDGRQPSPDVSIADDADDAEHQPTRPLSPAETPQPQLQAEVAPVSPAPAHGAAPQALEQVDTMQLTMQPQPQRRPIALLPQRLRSVSRPRGPLILLAVLLPILIIGGLSLWIAVAQPFSVSPVTQPWQSYNDPALGMSFIYPSDWSRQIDRNKSIVQLADSSHTAQVSVAVSNAGSIPLDQFAQQQAKQFGLTTTKPAPTLSFGGTTWQQLQGNTQISGANYSGRILSTTHGNRHYVIVQLAPLDTYSDEEKIIFSPMHASWKFRS